MDALREPDALRQLLAHIDAGVLIFDRDRRLTFANEAAAAIFQTTPQALLRQPPDLPEPPSELALPGGIVTVERLPEIEAEVWLLRNHPLAPGALLAGGDSGAQRLEGASLRRQLENEQLQARRSGTGLVALRVTGMADERVAERVASALVPCLRRTDTVARVNDGILVILPRTRLAEGAIVCQKLRGALAGLVKGLRLELNLALEALPLRQCSLEELLRLTDPERGHGFSLRLRPSSALDVLSVDAVRVVARLQAGEGFGVVALPVMRLEDGAPMGWELLSRGPQGRYHNPDALLQLASDAGIATHGDLVCLKSCLRASGALPSDARLHVNLLPGTLLDSDRPRLADIFDKAERRVHCVELAERLLVGDPGALLPAIKRLRAQGLQIALDGVGYGRSVLEALIVLEPELVKIDRQFIHGIARDPSLERPIRRLLKLLESMGSQCVATGLENDDDLRLVRQLGVPLAQGHLWGTPHILQPHAQGAAV